jgi:hypothetical protein
MALGTRGAAGEGSPAGVRDGGSYRWRRVPSGVDRREQQGGRLAPAAPLLFIEG